MRIWLVLGAALGLAAAGCLGVEVGLYFSSAAYEVLTLGRLWLRADESSLHALRAAAADRGPWTEALLAALLGLPAWAAAGVPAVVSLWAAWPAADVTPPPAAETAERSSVSDASDP